jgi:hypothetical protein
MDQKSQFDRLLNNTTRYVIVAHLARSGGQASFLDVLATMSLPHSGMLSQHSRKLEGLSPHHKNLRRSKAAHETSPD